MEAKGTGWYAKKWEDTKGWKPNLQSLKNYVRYNIEQYDIPSDIHDNCPEAYGEFVEVNDLTAVFNYRPNCDPFMSFIELIGV